MSNVSEREAELRFRIVSVKSLCGLCESFLQTSDYDELEEGRGSFACVDKWSVILSSKTWKF